MGLFYCFDRSATPFHALIYILAYFSKNVNTFLHFTPTNFLHKQLFVSQPLSNKCSCKTKQLKKANTCSLDTLGGSGGVKQTSVRPSQVLEQNFYKKDPSTSHYYSSSPTVYYRPLPTITVHYPLLPLMLTAC